MNEVTMNNLEARLNSIKGTLGTLAYNRRDYQIKIEQIDEQVAAMEAQATIIEATQRDLNSDIARRKEAELKELADAKAKRSATAKAAAKKRKRR